jgi:predicted RNA-binding Zn-ribbon protein involved in translation (DUF1610 family)
MTEPTHFQCPDCMFAFRGDDPRFAVPKGNNCRVMACPGCGGLIRRWAEGRSPSVLNYVVPWALVAIVIIVIVVFYSL